jgi:hypothetical protein
MLLIVIAALVIIIVLTPILVDYTWVAPWVATTNGGGARLVTTPTIDNIDTWDEDYLDWVDYNLDNGLVAEEWFSEEMRPLVGEDPEPHDWVVPVRAAWDGR